MALERTCDAPVARAAAGETCRVALEHAHHLFPRHRLHRALLRDVIVPGELWPGSFIFQGLYHPQLHTLQVQTAQSRYVWNKMLKISEHNLKCLDQLAVIEAERRQDEVFPTG